MIILLLLFLALPCEALELKGRVETSDLELQEQYAHLARFEDRLFKLIVNKVCSPEYESRILCRIKNDKIRHRAWQRLKLKVIPFTKEGDRFIREVESIAKQEGVSL